MQHSPAISEHQVRFGPLLTAVKYLLLALAAGLAVYELTAGHWLLLALASALALGLMHRTWSIEQSQADGRKLVPGEKFHDGGSFPASSTPTRPATGRPVVSDGGSFKRGHF